MKLIRCCLGSLVMLLGVVNSMASEWRDPALVFASLEADYKSIESDASRCERLFRLKPLLSKLDSFVESHPTSELVARLVSGQTVDGINLDVLSRERQLLIDAVDQEARQLVISARALLNELESATDWQSALINLQSIEEAQEKLHQTYYCRSREIKLDAIQIAAFHARFAVMREQDARRAIRETVVAVVISARAASGPCDKARLLNGASKSFDDIVAKFDGSPTVASFREGVGDSTNSLTTLQKEIQTQDDACHVEKEEKNKKANVKLIAVVSILTKATAAEPVKEKIRLYVAAREAMDRLLSDHPDSTVAKEHDGTGCFGKVCRRKITENIDKLVEAQKAALEHAFTKVRVLWNAVSDENTLPNRIQNYHLLINKLEFFIGKFSESEPVAILRSGGEVQGVSLKVAKGRLQTLLKERSQQASVKRQEIINMLAGVESASDSNGRLVSALQAQQILESLMALYSDDEISNQEDIGNLALKIESRIERETLALENLTKVMFVKASSLYEKGVADDKGVHIRRTALQQSLDILEDIQIRFPLSTIAVALASDDGFEGITLQAVQESISDLETDTAMRRTAVAALLGLMRCGEDKTQAFPKRIECFRGALEAVRDIKGKFPSVPVEVLCSSVGEVCPGAGKNQFIKQIAQLVASCERNAKDLVRNARAVIKKIDKERLVASRGLALLEEALGGIDAITSDYACEKVNTPVFREEVAGVRAALDEAINEKKELFDVAQRKFLALQTLCGKANAKAQHAKRQVGIAALDDCLRSSSDFSKKYAGTKFGQVIVKGGAFVPVLTTDEYRCEVQSDKTCLVRGTINQVDAKMILDPTQEKVILTAGQARLFKLSKGIKITAKEAGEARTLYVTRMDEIRFGPMRVRDIEAFVDPTATGDRVILGNDFLRQFDLKATQDAFVLRHVRPTGGVIANLGTPGLAQLRSQLIAADSEVIQKKLVDVLSLIDDARAIEAVTRFENRLALIDEAQVLIDDILNEHQLVDGMLQDRIDSIAATLSNLNKITAEKRETAAIASCDKAKTYLSQAKNAGSLLHIVSAMEGIRDQLEDLEYFYDGTRLVENLRARATICGLPQEEVTEQLAAAFQVKKAVDCKASGFQSASFDTRIKHYECALGELIRIERKYKKTIIAHRIRDNVVLTGVSMDLIEGLIEKERRAQALFKKARAMIQEEVHSLGYTERYSLMDEALVLVDELKSLKSAVNVVELKNLKKDAQEVYDDAALKMAIEPEIIMLSGQCYQMGSSRSDMDAASDEGRHQVCVDNYGIGKFEVTFREYDQYVRATSADRPKDRGWGRGDRPVIYVSADDVDAYIEWLNKETGKTYRLPTEAEWEFAARGGNDARYAWGDSVDSGRANCLNCGLEWSGRSAPVGSFEPNAYGLYDMAGNVWERTCSIYRETYEGSERVCASSEVSGDRVLRGGSWKSHSRKLRSANRQPSLDPYVRSAYRGFRLATDN